MSKRKNPHAVALGRKGGKTGGVNRWKGVSPEERSRLLREAVITRWRKWRAAHPAQQPATHLEHVDLDRVARRLLKGKGRKRRLLAASFLPWAWVIASLFMALTLHTGVVDVIMDDAQDTGGLDGFVDDPVGY